MSKDDDMYSCQRLLEEVLELREAVPFLVRRPGFEPGIADLGDQRDMKENISNDMQGFPM
ncbi:MAG: hypothetical protein DRO13_06120 [Thermoprotei archaeon]|nr:MAG: hypothetical protein DRO13_06120 [Thermoprotei archaeon]